MRIYEFDPINNNIAVKTYSPYTNKYETDSDSQFNLKGNLTSTATSYEWFVELFDGENKTTGPAWSFTTKLQAGNIINSNPMQQTEMAVKKHSSNELFTIYPNPNNTNYLTLSFNKEIREEVSVEIFNITGYLQFKKTFKNIDNITSLEHNLPTGTYIVAVTTKNSKEAKKLVIIK